LKRSLLYKRDFYAAGLMMLFGLFAAVNGPRYALGTLMHMGPGFMPTALGVILVLLGITIAVNAATATEGEAAEEGILPEHPQWLAWACILASPLAFIVFGKFGGMIPGTFMCVFVAALGDRDATWRGVTILASVVTLFGVLLFHYLLKIPMPVLKWGLQ
jgi:Tripartite tricarboxylate transporter TctB family